MSFIKKIKTLLFPPVDAKKAELIVQEITFRPEDSIVFSYDGILSNNQKERLRQAVDPWLKGEIKTLVLEKGMRVTVVRGHKQ